MNRFERLGRQIGQPAASLLTQADQLANRLVGRPHRHAAENEKLHQGRCIQKTILQPGGDGFLAELGPAHNGGSHFERHGHGVKGVKQRFLVLLQISIIAQGQTLHEHQQLLQVTDDPGRLAPD